MIFEALDPFNLQVRKHVSCLKMTYWLPASGQQKQKSYFIARIWSAEYINFIRYSIEREVIWKNTIFNLKLVEKGDHNSQF